MNVNCSTSFNNSFESIYVIYVTRLFDLSVVSITEIDGDLCYKSMKVTCYYVASTRSGSIERNNEASKHRPKIATLNRDHRVKRS